MGHEGSGSSGASTDHADASSPQDAAGQQAELIEVETKEGGASNKAKAACAVEPVKIFDVRIGAELTVP